MKLDRKKIIMFVGKGDSSLMVYNGIKNNFNIEKVVVENSGSKLKFLKRRIRKLGYWQVLGQVLFQKLYVPILRYFSKSRIKEIIKENNLSLEEYEDDKKIELSSINSNECLEILDEVNPDIILVNGTRIISKKILNSTKAIFINTHAGITPKYRGVHGAYWALANNDKDNCGVTIHLVDTGIDTGGILSQNIIHITHKDNFITYPYLQIVEGIKLLKSTLFYLQNNTCKVINKKGMSKLWYHPTIWQYAFLRFTKRVK